MVGGTSGHLRRNVVAYLALFIALGGTAYAAIQIPKDSVGSGSVKDESLRGADVRAESLTGSDIDEKTLALPTGPAGPAGPAGPQGPQGLKGDPGPDQISESNGSFITTTGPPAVRPIFDLPGAASMSIACNHGFGSDPGGSSVLLTNPSSDPMRWYLDEGGNNPRSGLTQDSALDAFSTLQEDPDSQVWRGLSTDGSFTAFVFTNTQTSIMVRICEWSAQLIVDE